MINLDQVRTLEWKVKQAVQLIVHLRKENDTLRVRLSDTEVRLQELESLLEAFKASQNELESGIRSALEELDHLEGAESPPRPVEAPPVVVAPVTPVVEVTPEPVLSVTPPEEPEDRAALSFEEEYAALAAEEEGAQSSVPESVELEASPEESGAEEDLAPVAPPVEEREPEQPGLGIF